MFNIPNNQQLIPMEIQQQQVVGMPIQNINTISTYFPKSQNIPFENDSYISFSNQKTEKGFWDGFKTVFSKIGQFCTDNFGLILTGLGIFGGYKLCSNSMKAYEENKKEGKLDDKGNLKDKDATIKENIMNFVGHGVHYVFGSSKIDETENDEEKEIDSSKETEVNEEKSNVYDIDEELSHGNISTLLKAQTSNANKIEVLKKIAEKIKDGSLSPSTHFDRRQTTIIDTLGNLMNCGDNDIKTRAKAIINNLKDNAYFSQKQQTKLKNLLNEDNTDV